MTQAWVIGAGGLLGSSVAQAVGTEAWQPPMPFRWGEPDVVKEQLRSAAVDFVGASGDRPWQVLWCAGVGVTATNPWAMEAERVAFAAMLEGLARTASHGLLFLSSSAGALYAGASTPPFDEYCPVAPISRYGEHKARMEDLANAWAASSGHAVLVGRISNLYGPAQNLAKPQGLISQVLRSQLLRRPLSIYVPLDTVRDYLFAPDCGRLVVALNREMHDQVSMGGTRIVVKNIASGRAVSVAAVLGEVRRLLKCAPRVVLGASDQSAVQARDLRIRSRIWPHLSLPTVTPLPVGMNVTLAHLRRMLAEGRL